MGGAIDKSELVFTLLLKYISFCQRWRAAFPELGLLWVETPLGGFSTTQASVMFFLAMIRFDGNTKLPAFDTDGPIKNKSKALKDKFLQLRNGIVASCIFQLDQLPDWVHKPPGQEPWIKHIFDKWFKEDPVTPAKPKGQLSKVQIAFWAMYIIGMYWLKPPNNIQELVMYALLLRVQSGANARQCSLAGMMWSDVGIGVDGVPWVTIYCYKPYACTSLTKKAKVKMASIMTLPDVLSRTLFMIWWHWFRPEPEECATTHFFPIVNMSDFNWKRPVSSENHTAACFEVAEHWHLVTSPDIDFSSKSVRRGNGTTTWGIVREILHFQNPMHGRMKFSLMEFHYAGEDVILAPGPLFTDIEDIQHEFEEFLCEGLDHRKNSLLCRACGYPACKCTKCIALNAGKSSHKGHDPDDCWLPGFFKETKTHKPTKQGYRLDFCYPRLDYKLAMKQAWSEYGIDGTPVWVRLPSDKKGSMGGYGWPVSAPSEIPSV